MKKLFLCSLLGISFITTTVSCQNAAKNAPKSTSAAKPSVQNAVQNAAPIAADLSVADFQKKLAADRSALVLDVRTPQEFANGHLPNAMAINIFDADFKQKVGKLDKSKAVYVYCAVGGRSAKASQILQESGFKTVYNMAGGFNHWQAAGLPSVK